MRDKTSWYYKIDFLGQQSGLNIYKSNKFKTTWGMIISILVFSSSISFFIYSFINWIKLDVPFISYAKDFSPDINRTLNLNQTVLMIQIANHSDEGIDLSDFIVVAQLSTHSLTALTRGEAFKLEKCDINNNIDPSVKDIVNFMEIFEQDYHQNYYCLPKNQSDILFYDTNYGFSELILYVLLKNESRYKPVDLYPFMYIESDSVNNGNKSNPINKGYRIVDFAKYNNDEYRIDYINLNYIHYESDNGILFKSNHKYKGFILESSKSTSYSKETFPYEMEGYHFLGLIDIYFQLGYVENYSRQYTKIQSWLADVECIINLIITIGGFITNLVSSKKMSVDLTRSLLKRKLEGEDPKFSEPNKTEVMEPIAWNAYQQNDLIVNQAQPVKANKINNIKITQNTNAEAHKRITNDQYIQNSMDTLKKSIYDNNQKVNKSHEEKMKSIGTWNILLSYLCCQTEKTKLVDLCDEFIKDELSIDKMLKRIGDLEKLYYLLSDEQKTKLYNIESANLMEITGLLDKIGKKELPQNTGPSSNSGIELNQNKI